MKHFRLIGSGFKSYRRILCVRFCPSMTVVAALMVLAAIGPVWGGELPDPLRASVPPPKLSAASWVLMDQRSETIIAAQNPDKKIEPASLSKLMTAYVVFDALKEGRLTLDQSVVVSEKAWRTGGSRMFIQVGSKVSVDDLLKGLIVQSGNDSAVALAEHLAGSEDGFADLMNQVGQRLGLDGSRFANSTGLPHPDHYMTARDLSVLSAALIRDFPEYYQYYSIKDFTYNGITQKNRNGLLWVDEAVDGVKTGHTSSAGYCLIGSAERDGMRLIATVTGTDSVSYREDAVYSLLKFGFAAYESIRVYDATTPVARVDIYKGDTSELPVGVGRDLYLVLAKGSAETLSATVRLEEPLLAPVNRGDQVGTLTVESGGNPVGEHPLVAMRPVTEGSWLQILLDSVVLWWK